GAQTITNVANRARELGLDIRRDDIRFALDVVSEADPWFEQGASANLFAGRFRNFVVARCRSHGVKLTPDEIDLIDAWFTGASSAPAAARPSPQTSSQSLTHTSTQQPASIAREAQSERWWGADERRATQGDQASSQRASSQEPAPAGE